MRRGDRLEAQSRLFEEFLRQHRLPYKVVGGLRFFDRKEIKDVMDLCLSCKGCKSECPSNVDMAKLKAEFLQHYYDANGVPMRATGGSS